MFYDMTVLDNGITVITEKMPDVRSVTLGLWFQVGSRDETPAQAGMSHFMEHMMFKGTSRLDAMGISSAFDGMGAELNAFTSREYTCYYARVVDEKMPQAFEILSDMVCDSLYDQSCIDSEREVVIEEISRSEDNPEDNVWDLFTDALFPQSPIGRPVIGTRDVVAGFMHDDCVSYHDRHYRSGNLVVAMAGNVEHDAVVEMAQRFLGALPALERETRARTADEPGERLRFLTKDTEQAHLVYGMRSYPVGHPDRFALALLEMALGGGMSSRLFQEIREKRGLAYAVFCQGFSHTDAGELSVYVGTRPDNLLKVLEILIDELDRFVRDGIEADELIRVRDFATGQIMLGLESTRSRMTRLGRTTVQGQPLLSIDEVIDSYRAVTAEDISRVAHDLLTRKPTLAVISPHTADEIADIEGIVS